MNDEIMTFFYKFNISREKKINEMGHLKFK